MNSYRNSLIHKLTHLSHYFKQMRFSRLEEVGLYQGQPRLLYTLRSEDGISQRELAERINVAPATLTRMLQRMEKNTLLERRPDSNDQRVTRVFITPEALDVLERLKDINHRMEEEIFGDFSSREKEELSSFLDRVMERMQDLRENKRK